MLKHKKYRKNVQIVEICQACGSSSTRLFSWPPERWCNMTATATTTASIIIRMAEDIEDIDGNDSAPQRTASCHIDSHRFTSHVRVWEHWEHHSGHHSIPFLPCKGKDKLSSTPRTSKTWVLHSFADRSRPNIALLTSWDTDSNTKDILGQVYLWYVSISWVSVTSRSCVSSAFVLVLLHGTQTWWLISNAKTERTKKPWTLCVCVCAREK